MDEYDVKCEVCERRNGVQLFEFKGRGLLFACEECVKAAIREARTKSTESPVLQLLNK